MPTNAATSMYVYALHDGLPATERRVASIATALKAKDVHVSFFTSLERNSLRPAGWDACLVLLTAEYLHMVNDNAKGGAARTLFDASVASSVPKIVVALQATLPTQLPGVVGEKLGSPMTLSLHEDPVCTELERIVRLQKPRSAFRGACKRVVARNRLVLLQAKRVPPPVATDASAPVFRARVKRIAAALEIPSDGEHLVDVVNRALSTLRVRCGADVLFCERVVKLERQLGIAPTL